MSFCAPVALSHQTRSLTAMTESTNGVLPLPNCVTLMLLNTRPVPLGAMPPTVDALVAALALLPAALLWVTNWLL